MEGAHESQKLINAVTSAVSQSSAAVPPVQNKDAKFSCDNFLPCDPRRYLHRYLLFLFMCMLAFGRYYCYDNPIALRSTIIEVMGLSSSQYNVNSLYLVYSWPNVIISIFGGFLLDRWLGIRIGTFVFCALVCVGQLVFALGGIFNIFLVMLIGRFIFGLGGENVAIARKTYMVMWFRINELNMAYGFLLSVSRIASTINQNFSQKLYDAFFGIDKGFVRLGVVLMIGFGICIISLLCAIFLGMCDKRAEKFFKKDCDIMEKITFKDIVKFPLKYWLLIIVCLIYYVTVDPFLGVSVRFFMDKYGLCSSDANFISSLAYLISIAGCPVMGFLVDRTGFNLFWLNLGIIVTFIVHVIFAFLPNYTFLPYLATSLMGIAYSMFAVVVWPLIALIIPVHQLGTAYGIMQAVQNLGLSVFIIIAGHVVGNLGYVYMEIMFLSVLSLALFFGVSLYLYDLSFGGTLNASGPRRTTLHKVSEDRADGTSVDSIQALQMDSEEQSAVIGRRAPHNYTSPLTPSSDFHIRNRLLSKIGKKIPDRHFTRSI